MNWTQLKTVLWLRWRLTRNQFSRRGGLNAAISIIALILGLWTAAGVGVGGFFAGWYLMGKATPIVMMLVWDGIIAAFLFIWCIGLLAELQRSETIDLARLLHLPISLQGVFVINYLVSLVTMSLIFFVPGMVGLSLGLLLGKGLRMIFMLPLVLSFVFMITAWSYCLRGWLLALMVNPRRRRNILMILTLAIVLLGQGPNLYFNVYLRHHHQIHSRHNATANSPQSLDSMIPAGWIAAQGYVPLLWVPNGAMALTEGNVLPSVLGSLGAFLLGALGLARAYSSTMRFYTGQEKVKAAAVKHVPISTAPASIPNTFIEKRVPFVPEDVSALMMALLRSMTRAPEIRMMLFTNLLVIVVLFGAFFSGNVKTTKNEMFQLFAATGAVAFTFFGLVQILFNQFGHDRDGFRILVLSPMRRRDVLLAKNLALAPIVLVLGLSTLVAMAFLTHLPVLGLFAALFKLPSMFLLLCLAGNFFSTWTPYRVIGGSLKPTKPPPKIILLIMVTQFFFPVVMLPIAIPPLVGMILEKTGYLPAPLVDAILSMVLLVMAAGFYILALNAQGNFLERREQRILQVVSQEVE